MDLNELFFRHQIALMRAAGARNHCEKESHKALAEDFAGRIAGIRRNLGARGAALLSAQEYCL